MISRCRLLLKEKGKVTLKEMSLATANYIDAHGYQSNVNHGAENKKSQMTELSSRNRSHLGRAVTVDSEITKQKTVGVSHRQSKRIRQMISLVYLSQRRAQEERLPNSKA